MADDRLAKITSVLDRWKAVVGAPRPGVTYELGLDPDDLEWLLARCRLLEAERITAIQQGREQAAQAIEALRNADDAWRSQGASYQFGLAKALEAVRGLPVPETNQEQPR